MIQREGTGSPIYKKGQGMNSLFSGFHYIVGDDEQPTPPVEVLAQPSGPVAQEIALMEANLIRSNDVRAYFAEGRSLLQRQASLYEQEKAKVGRFMDLLVSLATRFCPEALDAQSKQYTDRWLYQQTPDSLADFIVKHTLAKIAGLQLAARAGTWQALTQVQAKLEATQAENEELRKQLATMEVELKDAQYTANGLKFDLSQATRARRRQS
jgi:hypothetical protein